MMKLHDVFVLLLPWLVHLQRHSKDDEGGEGRVKDRE